MDKETINKFAEEMLKLLQSGTALMQEQLPLICKEVLHFYLAWSVVWLFVLPICAIAVLAGCRKVCQMHQKNMEAGDTFKEPDEVTKGAVLIGACITWLILAVAWLFNIYRVLAIIFAPRVYLLSYFKEMIS